MITVNVKKPGELTKYYNTISGYMTLPSLLHYRIDEKTERGANYTLIIPVQWKGVFFISALKTLLRTSREAGETPVDNVRIEYVDYVNNNKA